MKIGVIGLGVMGSAIVQRLTQANHEVVGYDINPQAVIECEKFGMIPARDIHDVAQQTRVIWLMLPIAYVDEAIKMLKPHLKGGDIIIDGGNSNYHDSMRRAESLAKENIFFLDCGTSGGQHGRALGFCLMVGGDHDSYLKVHPLLEAIAAPGALGHIGTSGSGHYVKMIHNGIEYGLMQAYAEGFQIIKEGSFKQEVIDLEELTRIWDKASIIRSWLLTLSHTIFEKDQELTTIKGIVAEGGTGQWTVDEAKKNKIEIPVIEKALEVRKWSQKTGGNYATKVVALLRHEFGGHKVEKESK